jgi:hypothetical protein
VTCGDGVDAPAARKMGNGLACAGEAEAVRQDSLQAVGFAGGTLPPNPRPSLGDGGCKWVTSSPGQAQPHPRTSGDGKGSL